jgi:UPF0755 protein
MSSRGKKLIATKLGYIAPFTVLSITLLLITASFARFWYYIKYPNIDLNGKSCIYVYIPTGTDFQGLRRILRPVLRNEKGFVFTAYRKHYENRIKAGKYKIREGMDNNQLVNILRSGRQEHVRLFFQNARTPAELAGKIAQQIEADSASLMRLFTDTAYLRKFGLDPDNIFALLIPNTYEFQWNTSAEQFLRKMSREQKDFWTPARRQLLDSGRMDISQVVTLASIVEKETNKEDEKSIIAGVYINRLYKKWPLQADPTVIFAWHDYTIKRLTSRHLKIKSRYNTYLFTGLPPGPICIPSVNSIDAVLHFKKHKFMYFCAKEDLSGYHNFAVTIAEHEKNARNYQKALDKLNIN